MQESKIQKDDISGWKCAQLGNNLNSIEKRERVPGTFQLDRVESLNLILPQSHLCIHVVHNVSNIVYISFYDLRISHK